MRLRVVGGPEPEHPVVRRLRRDSPEWKVIYSKRPTIERVFKSLKESRRLERYGVRASGRSHRRLSCRR